MRAGRGAPVVLLVQDPEVAELLVTGFPRRFRALAPILGSATEARTPDFSSWVRRFLDALGTPRVSLVADASFAADALGYALQDPDRVDRLVFFLSPASAQSAEPERGIVDRLVTAGQTLLATPFDVRDAAARERALDEIGNFLDTREIPL